MKAEEKLFPSAAHHVRFLSSKTLVLWGGLTGSKLLAPSYEDAGITRPAGTLFREEGLIGKASPS